MERGTTKLVGPLMVQTAAAFGCKARQVLMSLFWALLAIIVGGFIPEYAFLKDEIPGTALSAEEVETGL